MAEAQDVIKLSYYLTATIFYILKTSKQNKKKKKTYWKSHKLAQILIFQYSLNDCKTVEIKC